MEHDEAIRKAILYDLRRDKTLIGKCKVTADFIFFEVNEVLCKYFQCTPAQLIGTAFTTITLPDDNEIDVKNALAIKQGLIDNYQFPKRYKPQWIQHTVYAVTDVIGVRAESGEFLHYDVEILEISKAEYLRLKRVVLKRELGILRRALCWTGNLSWKEVKGLIVWAVLLGTLLGVVIQSANENLKGWLERLSESPWQ